MDRVSSILKWKTDREAPQEEEPDFTQNVYFCLILSFIIFCFIMIFLYVIISCISCYRALKSSEESLKDSREESTLVIEV